MLCGALHNYSESQYTNLLFDESLSSIPECSAKTYISKIPWSEKKATTRF